MSHLKLLFFPFLCFSSFYFTQISRLQRIPIQINRDFVSDPEPYVRREAVYALSFRDLVPETFEAQKRALFEDESVLVRLSVLKNFSKVYEETPEVVELIQRIAEIDPSEDVRKAASDILDEISRSEASMLSQIYTPNIDLRDQIIDLL